MSLEDIWQDDKLNRRSEAELLFAYLESVTSRPLPREWSRAFTLAVDSGYGSGKTFFLRRFAETVRQKYPVAFVDAWADDLQDQPFVALVATLHEAMKPLITTDKTIERKWSKIANATSRVAKAAGVGLLKRGLAYAITDAGVEGVDAAFASIDVDPNNLRKLVEVEAGQLKGHTEKATIIDTKVAEFRDAKAAVADLKIAIRELLKILNEKNPGSGKIFIVIDEIDRCRPTYAIKLLEEIKHLFDVEGLTFILGIHKEALSRSVVGAYGPEFDGWQYLKRFITKTYNLKDPGLRPLVEYYIESSGIDIARLKYPPVFTSGHSPRHAAIGEVISLYMKDYDLKARDVAEVIDDIRTCLALTGNNNVLLIYLLPLLLSRFSKDYGGSIIEPALNKIPWSVSGSQGGLNPRDFAMRVHKAARLSTDALINVLNTRGADEPEREVLRNIQSVVGSDDDLSYVRNYPLLVESVGRFT